MSNPRDQRIELWILAGASALFAMAMLCFAAKGGGAMPLLFALPFIVASLLLTWKARASDEALARDAAREASFLGTHPMISGSLLCLGLVATGWWIAMLVWRFIAAP